MSQAEFLNLRDGAAKSRWTSDAVFVDGWGFLNGILPIDLEDDKVALPEWVEEQTGRIFANLETLLKARGLGREHVVSVRVHLTEFKRFYDRMNSAYVGFFGSGKLPSRTCVGVGALERGALVAMDFVVRKPAS